VQSYTGVYTSGAGRRMEVKNASDRLALAVDGHTIPLQQSEDGSFIAGHAGFELFPIVFERAAASTSADPTDNSKRPITALSCGAEWFAREGYRGQPPLEPSTELARYAGKYYSENPWYGVIRVVQRQRQLWMGGTEPLTAVGNHLFRVGEQPSSPSVAEFSEWVDDAPQLLWFDGAQFRRVGDVNS
jgi:hypothetical protein